MEALSCRRCKRERIEGEKFCPTCGEPFINLKSAEEIDTFRKNLVVAGKLPKDPIVSLLCITVANVALNWVLGRVPDEDFRNIANAITPRTDLKDTMGMSGL